MRKAEVLRRRESYPGLVSATSLRKNRGNPPKIIKKPPKLHKTLDFLDQVYYNRTMRHIKSRHCARYQNYENKIHSAVDKLYIVGDYPTKINTISTLVNMDASTLHNHYNAISDLLTNHDLVAYYKLKQHLCLDNEHNHLEIIFLKAFRHIFDHQEYFTGATARANYKLFELFITELRPFVLRKWSNECALDKNTLARAYHTYAFNVLREFRTWKQREGCTEKTIDNHVKNLVYLTDAIHRQPKKTS